MTKIPKLLSEYYLNSTPKAFKVKFLGGPLDGLVKHFHPDMLREKLYVPKPKDKKLAKIYEPLPQINDPANHEILSVGVYEIDSKEYAVRLAKAQKALQETPKLKGFAGSDAQHMLNYHWKGWC